MEKKINVLFVAAGNSKNFDIAPFVRSQGESLSGIGVHIDYFTVQGKGLSGYLKNAKRLRKYVRSHPVDIIHAHYTLSGWVAVLSFSGKPIVLSLMGSDAYGDYIGPGKIRFSSRYLILLTYLIQPFIRKFICKSEFIKSFVFNKRKAHIIPNGILPEQVPETIPDVRKHLGLDETKKYVLFLGNTDDKRKNFEAVSRAMLLLNDSNAELLSPHPVPHPKVIEYMHAVDVLVVPSFMEGSPNVVKEAMACNCQVVATDVGDVRWLFGNEAGYYLTGFNPADIAENISKALDFSKKSGRTEGRKRIETLGLYTETVAMRIRELYLKLLPE